MKRVLVIFLLQVLQPAPFGAEVTVGTINLSIPAPEGYSPITSEMQPYADFAKRFVTPTNDQLAIFLVDADTRKAARGEIPEPKKWFSVQTTKKLVPTFATSVEFSAIKQSIRAQADEIMKKAKTETQDFFGKLNKGISDDFKTDLGLALNQMVPQPPYHETDRSLAYVTLVTYGIKDAEGKDTVLQGVVVTNFIHVRGKVLFLYGYGERADVEWCKETSVKWGESIILANPSSDDVAAMENRKPSATYEWSGLIKHAIIGAIAGVVVVVFKFGSRK